MTLLGKRRRLVIFRFNGIIRLSPNGRLSRNIHFKYTSEILKFKNIGIYRDDGLISISNINEPITSKIQKKLIIAFPYLKIVNFLDVTLNLNNNSYKPFSKTNAIPTYIHISSNHPASIVKQILNEINIRIKRLSFSKNIFNNQKHLYNETIQNGGYKNEPRYLEAKRHHSNKGNNLGNKRTNNMNIGHWIHKILIK